MQKKVLTWTTLQKEFSFRLLRDQTFELQFRLIYHIQKLQRKTFQNFVFSTDKTVDKKKANHIKKRWTTPKNIFWGKKIHSYAWNVSLNRVFNCRRQSDLNFMLYIFFVKCKETINHETCQEIKTFDFSQLLHTPSKTRKKGLWLLCFDFMAALLAAAGGDFDPLTHINIILQS